MATILTKRAAEESTYIITAAFTDEDDNAVTPNALTWTLSDLAGNVINSREDVALTPATSVNIVLTGDDLAIGTNGLCREVVIKGDYDSSAGAGLAIVAAARFEIEDIVKVPV